VDSAEQIEEQAADWLARRSGGDWSDADEAQLAGWLQASTAHKVAFIRLEAAWSQANRLRALGAGTQPGTIPARGHWGRAASFDADLPVGVAASASVTEFGDELPQPPPLTRGVVGQYAKMVSLAAGVLLAVALGLMVYFVRLGGPSFRTTVGGVAAIPLSDGSKVTLNTDSQIRIAVTRSERRVNLGQGEAFFEVAKDPSRPFVVVAGDCRVVAVGTKFSVWREASEVRVAVTEGRVRVERDDRDAHQDLAAQEIDAGSIAHASDSGLLVQRKRLSEVEEDLSWRRGFLFFHDVPLAQAVAEFNRYNAERIVIATPSIADIRIGGNFRSTNVAGFIRLLQDGFSIRAEQRGNEIVLSGS
jgi:transmembrane sensor